MANKRETIAIIGGGAAGLGAAWLLDESFDITIYEGAAALGGHARTVYVPSPAGSVPVDMGVIITKPWGYPNLYGLLELLDVPTFSSGVTIGASFGPHDTWVTGGGGALWERIREECSRFELAMFQAASLPEAERARPIRHLLRRQRYSRDFIDKALCPVLAMLVVTGSEPLDVPLSEVASLFPEYFSFFAPITWRFFSRGTHDYVERLAARLRGKIRVDAPVAAVRRHRDGVTVVDASGNAARFDQVVIATGADSARAIVMDATPLERTLLDSFRYARSRAYVHTDESVLSPYLPRSTSFQYTSFGDPIGPEFRGAVTYDVGAHYDAPGLFATLSWEGTEAPLPRGILASQTWAHLIVTPHVVRARARLHEIQGVRRTWYCGEYTTVVSHEGALVSGMAVAEAIGAKYPLAGLPLAARGFAALRGMMFPKPLEKAAPERERGARRPAPRPRAGEKRAAPRRSAAPGRARP